MRQHLLIALAILVASAAIPVSVALWRRRQLRSGAAGREGKAAREAFIQRLSPCERTQAEAVYEELQRFAAKDFPLMPDDRFLEDLDIDQGALESFFEEEGIEQASEGPRRIRTCAELAMALIRKRKAT